MPFGLKNAGATFQQAMTYIFHDLAHIILAYLDDLTTRSKKRTQHLDDLQNHLPTMLSVQHPLESPQVCILWHHGAPPLIHCFPKQYYRGPPQNPSYH
jgi:hypothetical protein